MPNAAYESMYSTLLREYYEDKVDGSLKPGKKGEPALSPVFHLKSSADLVWHVAGIALKPEQVL
jgi:hypothetical protein